MNHLFDQPRADISSDALKSLEMWLDSDMKFEDNSTNSTCTPTPRDRCDSISSTDLSSMETPHQLVPLESTTLGLVGDALELFIAPGDILYVPGTGRLGAIGTAGGFLGHVILVLQPPQCIARDSAEAAELAEVWPSEDVRELWKVRTIESNRVEKGFTECDALVFVDRKTSRLTFCGEISLNGELYVIEPEVVEIFQSPSELRSSLRPDLMHECIQQMYGFDQRWSAFTAMKAVFKPARVYRNDGAETLIKIQNSWTQKPICTSVPVIFWQRYLCRLAKLSVGEHDSTQAHAALDLILRWMPLRADRVLPGDLISVLREVGWICITSIPQIFKPLVVMQPPKILKEPLQVPGSRPWFLGDDGVPAERTDEMEVLPTH